ncbi:MAG: FtsW/RodA/SpoVE family cell cycle protein [Actinomycetales bacterium]|nr:FtsW/RodA/SpoVE family cell cycle protein [Actinomycetales bacterium]
MAEQTAAAVAGRGNPRNRELWLLVVAVLIVAAGLANVDLTVSGAVSAISIRISITIAAAALAAHVAVRLRAANADPLLLPLAVLLTGIGTTVIHRLDLADELRAVSRGEPVPTAKAGAQATWFVVGAAAMALTIIAVRDHRRIQRYPWTLTLLGLVLVLAPLVPGLGRTIRGATLWVSIAGLSFQPAEVAKVVLTIGFASYLSRHGRALGALRARVLGIPFPRPRDLGPLLTVWALSLSVLILQRDLGTSLLFFGVFVVLLYIATEQRSWPLIGLLLFSAGATVAWSMFAHVQVRVALWLDPFTGDGTSQVALGLYGLANGGLFGAGLGGGYPQLVPFAESDFIFASLGEELGLVGCIAVLLVYAVLVSRGLKVANTVRDRFGLLLAAGIATVIALQTFVVLGGVTRLIPLTGLTTPFLSSGGSSLVANFIMVGLLIRMSHAARTPAAATGSVAYADIAAPRHDTGQPTQIIELPTAEPRR